MKLKVGVVLSSNADCGNDYRDSSRFYSDGAHLPTARQGVQSRSYPYWSALRCISVRRLLSGTRDSEAGFYPEHWTGISHPF